MTGRTGDTSHHNQPEPRRCWTEPGAHFFAKESDGIWVCQVCGDVRTLGFRWHVLSECPDESACPIHGRNDDPAAAVVAGRDTTGSTQ